MLKLFGRPTSINVRKVLWTGAELGLVFDHEPTDSADMKTPAFVALNPNALVPVLVDDGFVVWESNTICRYLAGREGRRDLLPSDPAPRAVVEQWMDWQASELNPAWRYAYLALMRGHPAHPDPALVAASVVAWNRQMTLLDGRLATTGAYVAGDAFTLADIPLGLAAYRWTMTPIERPPLPAVDAWLARLAERAPYRAHGGNGVS